MNDNEMQLAQKLFMALLDKLPKVEAILTYDEVMACSLAMRREFKARIEERLLNPVSREEDASAYMSFSDVYSDVADALQRASDYMHMNEIKLSVVGLPFTLFVVLKDAMKTPLGVTEADGLAGSATTKELIGNLTGEQRGELEKQIADLQAAANAALDKAGLTFLKNEAIPKELSKKLSEQLTAANDNQPTNRVTKVNEHLN